MPVNTADLGPGGTVNNPTGLVGTTEFGYVSAGTLGTALLPTISFSDNSLGFYQSAASTVALSYGTLTLPSGLSIIGGLFGGTTSTISGGQGTFASGISVGSSSNTGSLIPAISSTSSLVAAFVVAGSASSFTWIAWPAAQRGDQILTTTLGGAGISSVSSGLIPWSHCTTAGQIEFRLSNVSTLVQNQSSVTWFFTRIAPF